MARAELYLEDEGMGVAVKLRHIDGFNPDSPAHRMVNQLVKFMDNHAEWKQDESTTTEDTDS